MVADILHVGHIIAIEEARQKCDHLIVCLHCKPLYKQPIQSIYERFMQLRAIKWIDEIIPYENKNDVENLIKSLDFDIYFLGEDYKNKEFEGFGLLKDLNKTIYYLKRQHNFSSTLLKQKMEIIQ